MSDDTSSVEPNENQFQNLQIALAAQEGERARLLAKYDGRISELKKAIKTLERDLARKTKPTPEKTVKKPKRPRKLKTPK
jgi:hypothetical protein